MAGQADNIHPIFDQLLQRHDKEKLLNQRAKVLWMTGLSGSGKSTIAKGLESYLHQAGQLSMLLDGDNVRTGLNSNLGFSDADRRENIRRIAEVAKLFLNCGVITIACFVSPTIAIRDMARDIIGTDDFLEVFVNCPLEVCEERDVKGLYKKARAGEIKDFTGIDAPFEAPVSPAIEVNTDRESLEESVNKIITGIQDKIQIQDT